MSFNVERTSDTAGRRRRLIAADDKPGTADLLAEFGIFSSPRGEPVVPLHEAGDRLVRRIISRRLWKHVTVLTVLSALVLALISLAAGSEAVADSGPVPDPPQLIRTMAGLQLLASGQLAFLIGWIRARSQLDFRGRYRVWKWIGTALLTAATVTLANLQSSIPGSFAAMLEPVLGTITAARPALLILPVAGVSVVLLVRVLPDLGRHRVAQALLTVAALCGFISLIGVDAFVQQPSAGRIGTALSLFSAHLTFCSLLLHARFVAWISNDPPESRRVAAAAAGHRSSRKKQRKSVPTEAAGNDAGDAKASPPEKSDSESSKRIPDQASEDDESTAATEHSTEPASNAEKPSRSSRRGRGKRRLRKAG